MKGIIYRIKELSTGETVYVGSTTQRLSGRKSGHIKACFIKNACTPVYVYIRERCDKESFHERFTFEQLFTGKFDDRTKMRKAEKEFIEKLHPICNKNRAYVSKEEKAKDNRERIKSLRDSSSGYRSYCGEKSKQFFDDNPDYFKNWAENNREKRREASKRYRETHIDKVKEINRKWHEKTKKAENA